MLFNSVNTLHKKVSIISSKKGKGRNLYNFFNFCLKNDITYAITIDADLKSFQKNWIIKMIKKMEEGYDFICPLYKRKKEEGNTTNHFVCPVLYSVYGVFIRQPIGGDYAFNRKFITEILKEKFDKNILQYGIDIFMLVTAIVKKMKIIEVNLGKKEHGNSYFKMLDIFEGVVKGFNETYKHYPVRFKSQKINYNLFEIKNSRWAYLEKFKKTYTNYLKDISYNYDEAKKEWINILRIYINSLPNIDEKLILEMKKQFLRYCVNFWYFININDNVLWEKIIVDNCLELGGKNEVKN